jgi:hypothetical protein
MSRVPRLMEATKYTKKQDKKEELPKMGKRTKG